MEDDTSAISRSAQATTSGIFACISQICLSRILFYFEQEKDLDQVASMESRRSVTVIGSLNVDFVTRTPRIPQGGETFAATSFSTGFGGKGANQAVAAARLAGPDVQIRMVGNVGDDSFGRDYVLALEKEGIDASEVRKLPGKQTGVTNIIVEENSGENRILFVANANFDAFEKQQGGTWDLLSPHGDVLVFQLEIPTDVVRTMPSVDIHVY